MLTLVQGRFLGVKYIEQLLLLSINGYYFDTSIAFVFHVVDLQSAANRSERTYTFCCYYCIVI